MVAFGSYGRRWVQNTRIHLDFNYRIGLHC
jgi:hypothetical protein